MIKESKGNMYEFVTHTWNPIKGKCLHGCTYCYMKKMCSRLNAPRLDAAELTSYLECSNFIFVGSSIDMWAEDIPSDWIRIVLDCCNKAANKYLFQSKNPSRILEFITHPVFHRSVACTTIETNRSYPERYPEQSRCDVQLASNRRKGKGYGKDCRFGYRNLCYFRAVDAI